MRTAAKGLGVFARIYRRRRRSLAAALDVAVFNRGDGQARALRYTLGDV